MRLTLRTLLAWLDGVLPQGEQEQLGVKVSSSAVATQLAERIRLAVGRSQVGTPQIDGRGLADDANSVAEYLDNTLEADKLEAFERICIDSEMHLAEVAACHCLLAEVARSPQAGEGLHEDERQRLRQRVRGLLAGLHDRPIIEHAVVGDGHADAREQMHAIRDALARDLRVSADGAARDAAPGGGRSVRRRTSGMAWVSAAAAALLLVGLSLALAWTFVKPAKEPAVAARSGQIVAAAEGPPFDPTAEGAADGEPSATLPDGEAAAAADAAAATGAPPLPTPDDQPATIPRPAPVTDSGSTPAMGQTEGAAAVATAAEPKPAADGDPGASTAGAVLDGPPSRAADAPGQPTAADPTQPLGFVGGEGLLLRLSRGDEAAWTLFPVGSQLSRREDLLVPPASHPEIHVRGVMIRLLPETRVVLSEDGDGTPRIEVVFGRAVARASRPDVRLGITAGGLVGRVEAGLLEPAAVEVVLQRPVGVDPASAVPRVSGRVITASRGLSWRQTETDGQPATAVLAGIGAEGLLDAGMLLEWNSDAPDRIAVVRDRALPSWIESATRPDRLELEAVAAVAARAGGAVPLVLALREMAADRRVENRMLAAATLALVGEFDELVELLAADSAARMLKQQQWTQLEEATVPLALSRGGNAAERLYRAFVDRGPHGKADVLWEMARGVTDAELAAGADRMLVERLDDPNLIVRRYAYKQLLDITRPADFDRGRYRPDRGTEMRREGLAWWRGQLERGLVRRSGTAPGQ